jgi:Tfp pilus assembly protein PilF
MRKRRLGRFVLAVVVAGALSSCTAIQSSRESLPPEPGTSAPPQEVAAYHLVEDGRQQLVGGQTEVAIATFQKALALAPSSPHANLALAEAKVQQGAFKAALVYCDRVVRLVGDDPAWRSKLALTRAHAFEGLGDVMRAMSEFRRVLDDDPGNWEAREALARLESAPPEP